MELSKQTGSNKPKSLRTAGSVLETGLCAFQGLPKNDLRASYRVVIRVVVPVPWKKHQELLTAA